MREYEIMKLMETVESRKNAFSFFFQRNHRLPAKEAL
jgi:hypothetical protein